MYCKSSSSKSRLHSINDVFASLEAYFPFPVDERSSELLIINTSKGLYKVKRLPFGVKLSSYLSKGNGNAIERHWRCNCSNWWHWIKGTDEDDLNQRTTRLLQRSSEAGFELKKSKCQFNIKQVQFLGYIMDAEGIHPTPNKMAAVHQAKTSTNKKELQALLGFINFYDRFLEHKASVAEPLHRILDKHQS